jgi:hypothetical protein
LQGDAGIAAPMFPSSGIGVVGITSQREIERVVREGKVEGTELKLRMTLTAENAPLNHIVEETIDLC